jgi:hypothetical protein
MISICHDDPTSAAMETHAIRGYARDDWSVRIEATLRITVTYGEFVLMGEIRTFEHDKEVLTRVWDRRIPRLLV